MSADCRHLRSAGCYDLLPKHAVTLCQLSRNSPAAKHGHTRNVALMSLLQFRCQSEVAGKGQWARVLSTQQCWGRRMRPGSTQAFSALWGQSSHTGPDTVSGGRTCSECRLLQVPGRGAPMTRPRCGCWVSSGLGAGGRAPLTWSQASPVSLQGWGPCWSPAASAPCAFSLCWFCCLFTIINLGSGSSQQITESRDPNSHVGRGPPHNKDAPMTAVEPVPPSANYILGPHSVFAGLLTRQGPPHSGALAHLQESAVVCKPRTALPEQLSNLQNASV